MLYLSCQVNINLCRVYTCRFDNQVPNVKLVKKHFLVVKLAQYLVCEVRRKLAPYCNQEILIQNFESCFHKRQVSFLVVKTVSTLVLKAVNFQQNHQTAIQLLDASLTRILRR